MNYKEQYAEATGRPDWADQLALLPPHMVDGMVRYIVHGIPAGSFMMAVLSGDLFDALRRADEINMYALPAYGRFLTNFAPSGCYGSESSVSEWIKGGGLTRVAA